jgi:hypothetical protein
MPHEGPIPDPNLVVGDGVHRHWFFGRGESARKGIVDRARKTVFAQDLAHILVVVPVFAALAVEFDNDRLKPRRGKDARRPGEHFALEALDIELDEVWGIALNVLIKPTDAKKTLQTIKTCPTYTICDFLFFAVHNSRYVAYLGWMTG